MAAPGLLVPAPAHAAVQVSVETGALVIQAEGPDPNIVDIRFDGALYQVWDATPGLGAGQGCLATDIGRAICMGEVGAATIRGSDGDDVIDLTGVPIPVEGDGGSGDDALNGGVGQNTLTGGPGIDGLIGSIRDDRLDGGDGDDLLVGRDGKDVEFGGADDDILDGGAGSGDTLAGNAGADLLQGGPGEDVLQGDSGADVLAGGSGQDSLSPGTGDDAVLTGGGGEDTLQCAVPLTDSDAPAPPCAEVRSRRAPGSWPPVQAEAEARKVAEAAGDPTVAVPFPPGNARYVKVRISAGRVHKVRVCIETTSYQTDRLGRYTARTKTKYWRKIRRPRPPKRAFIADVSRRRC
jgi:hypothetical protein